jgi:hypothetical protein
MRHSLQFQYLILKPPQLRPFQLYYNLSFADLADGLLVDPLTGQTYRSLHKLTSEDFLNVAGTARHVLRFDKTVEWTEAAVQVT